MKVVVGVLIAFAILLVVMTSLACSSSEKDDKPSEAVSPHSTASTDNPQPVSLAPVPYFGEESIEERIVNADAIVIARLDRTTNKAVTGSGGTYDGKYFPALEFHLTVSNYLKGSGGNNITALWIRRDPYDTRQEAENAVPDIAASRDTTWDSRESILFLTKEADLAAKGDDFFSAAVRAANDYITMGFRLNDRHSKLWLPSAGTAGTGDNQEFLLAVPEAGVTTPTITIGELKSRIVAINTELDAGDGSDAYRECISNKYGIARENNYLRKQPGYSGPDYHPLWDGSFTSGQPAGTQLYEYDYGHVLTENGIETKSRVSLDGEDATLFSITEGALRPGWDANVKQFVYSVQSVRPMPAGTYRFNHNYMPYAYIPCGHADTFEMTANVAGPEGVLHEAFFDPVAIGTAVGADATNGVLKPTSFTVGQTAIQMTGLKWENNQVVLALDTFISLSGYVLDFIVLDGSVSLSLSVADAMVDAGVGTYSWSLGTQPWEAGDLLMLRIREDS